MLKFKNSYEIALGINTDNLASLKEISEVIFNSCIIECDYFPEVDGYSKANLEAIHRVLKWSINYCVKARLSKKRFADVAELNFGFSKEICNCSEPS